ncbi:hypothetical protein [Arsenicicoccus piscis]|uniref:Glucose-6-phosphate dehydrogenase NAD-binding domain-containing protein n=1 Tax=Arsenicicoccus piscis TaxID=673954 RepID=A0ABQ6HRW3_9MICO|nr:hypothetical protein [Arsenicicoccus piscis]GMA20917.1 hypothetical protein GCM10025862_29380 [Arsenicicoccus piscis]
MSSQNTPEPTPTAFVVLGATGDLTARLLLPGLGSLMSVDPARRVRLVGVGRDAWDDERWRTLIREALTAAGVDAEAVDTTTELAVSPYGEVLRGVLDRDLLLSVRDDFVAEAWRIVDPVLESWRAGERPLDEYPAGSTGPVRS